MHRGAPISIALYDLNKTWQMKKKEKARKEDENQTMRLQEEAMKEKNKVSDKYFCQKFEREFQIVI
jgi:hypothetical protein